MNIIINITKTINRSILNYLRYLLFSLLLFTPFVGTYAQTTTELSQKDILKRNAMIIYDIFLNYELAEAHGGLQTMIDHITLFNKKVKSTHTETVSGGSKEIIDVKYRKAGGIEKMTYHVERDNGKIKTYSYDFNYNEKDKLKEINLNGKLKYRFLYNRGALFKLILFSPEKKMQKHYSMFYKEEPNKVRFSLKVIKHGKSKKSPRNYYAYYNSDFKVSKYNIDIYSAIDITYEHKRNIQSYAFYDVMDNKQLITWEFSYDKKNNWIERKVGSNIATRTIVY